MIASGYTILAEYFLRDHLGTVRVVCTDTDNDTTAEIIQENHYYPFGMEFSGTRYMNGQPDNPFMYQGKENHSGQQWLNLNLYDFGARMFDGQTGRWNVPDPVNQGTSPYCAMGNNPVGNVDPDGCTYIGASRAGNHFDITALWAIYQNLMQDRMEWNDYVASFSAGGSNPLREVYSELQISLKNDDEIDGNGGGYYDSTEEAIENILKDNASQKVTASNQVEEVRNFENGDGYITYEEAYWTFKLSEGKVDLFADINKLDLSKIKASDFPGGVGSDQVFNLASKDYFTSFEQALVYGNITLRLLPGNMVIAHSDTYNFDIKNQPGTFWRDVFTGIGYMYNGYGKPFQIHFTGIAQINP